MDAAVAGMATAAPGNGQILPAPAAIAEALAATGPDTDMAAAAAEPRDNLVDASEPASPGERWASFSCVEASCHKSHHKSGQT